MLENVHSKVVFDVERGLAQVAVEERCIAMTDKVTLQRGGVDELLGAVVAAQIFALRMDERVLLQRRRATEMGAAHVAVERLVAGMGCHMAAQVAWLHEAFRADRAVRLLALFARMNVHVHLEVVPVGEEFTALVALQLYIAQLRRFRIFSARRRLRRLPVQVHVRWQLGAVG